MDHREQFCIEIKDGSTESLNVNRRSYCKDQRKQLFDTLLSPDGLECVVPVSPVKIRRLMKGLQMRTVDNIFPSMTVGDFLITSTPSTVTTNENVRRRNNPGNQLLRPACKRGVLPRFIYQRCLKTSPSAADQRGNATKVVPVFTSAERSKMADRFDCDNCKESLYGRKYIQSDDSPYCIPCYDSLFSNTCDECKELIGHDARELFYEDRHYHEHCFRCFRCDRSLADEPFTSQDDALLCNDCYCNEFSSKCVACDKIVMPGTRKLEYSGSTWHEGCFICHSCEQPIGSKSFIPDKDLHYCVPCYEDKFAPRCARCKKTLAKGGVTYRDEPFHKECFVCTNCTTQLAGQHFTSREDSPYCLKCFGSLYAKKCEACSKPITGFGGGKYISFEDRQWHQPCFTCSQCSVSLVGAGFFPNDERILCRDCHTNL